MDSLIKLIFAELFWFAIIGVFGAILYRLNVLLALQNSRSKTLQEILDWIPVRLFMLSAALVSHFIIVMPHWLHGVFARVSSNKKILADCGLATLQDSKDQSVEEIIAIGPKIISLIDRVLIVWLVVMAVAVIVV